MSKSKKQKGVNDPIEEYLENFSKLTFKAEDYDNKSSSVLDVIFGFLFHFLFLLIFSIYHLQNSSSKGNECKTPTTNYWVQLIIIYHMSGAFCCLIFIPLGNFGKIIFTSFTWYINYLTSFLRVILAMASLAIFLLICIKYEWESDCQTLNELIYVYMLLSGTCYCLVIFFGICLFFANLIGKTENCNKSYLNLSKTIEI